MEHSFSFLKFYMKKSEYDQEIPQSQTADNPMAPRGVFTLKICMRIDIEKP